MMGALLQKEFLEYRRDRRLWLLGVLLFLLLSAASLDGWNRFQADASARASAVEVDRKVWVEQGDNNPHGAAHFSRYAFRPLPVLSAFDPGVFDFAGAAFWMEAHTQNPTSLRRVEDVVVHAPFSSLSPAWVVLVAGSLLVATVLFSSVSRERENGTLKALAASGLSARDFVVGKMGAPTVLIFLLVVLAMTIALGPLLLTKFNPEPTAIRVLMLLVLYFCVLLSFSFAVLWISACARSSGEAFNLSALLWIFFALASPLLAGQLATTIFPDIDEQSLRNEIQLKAQTPFWVGSAGDDAKAAQERAVEEEFGVSDFDSLGFDREALVLQAHEEFANKVYDELYGELQARHRNQDSVQRYMSVLSPLLAAQRISAGIAGTDLLAQWDFADSAEQHRREIIELLNRDMMIHGADKGFSYMADRSLWESIPDYQTSAPSLKEVVRYYFIELSAVCVWLVVMAYLAFRALKTSLVRGQ